MKRVVSIVILVVLMAFAIRFGLTFPWKEMFVTLAHAALGWVVVGSIANVLSTMAKGEAWAILMNVHGKEERKIAHVATLVGAAAGSIAVSVGGDAMRVRWLVKRTAIKTTTALRALVASRFTEAITLAALILLGTGVLPSSSWVRASAIFAAVILVAAVVLWWWGRKHKHSPWPQRRIAQLLAEARMVLHQHGVVGALFWSLMNWLLQWFSFWAAIVAVTGSCPLGYPLAVLILANIGGALKLPPANVGVLTAAMLMVAKPFGMLAAPAFAASIVMQAVQTVPALLVGGVLVVTASSYESAESQ